TRRTDMRFPFSRRGFLGGLFAALFSRAAAADAPTPTPAPPPTPPPPPPPAPPLTCVTDPLGKVVTYTYDACDGRRLTAGPPGSSFTYDADRGMTPPPPAGPVG